MTEVQAAANATIQTHDPDLTYTLTVTPADLSTSSDTITVTVDADLRSGGWIVSKQILGSNMSETLVLKRN